MNYSHTAGAAAEYGNGGGRPADDGFIAIYRRHRQYQYNILVIKIFDLLAFIL